MLGNIAPVNQGFSPTLRSRRDRAMASPKAAFDKAVADSKNLPEKPDNMTLL